MAARRDNSNPDCGLRTADYVHPLRQRITGVQLSGAGGSWRQRVESAASGDCKPRLASPGNVLKQSHETMGLRPASAHEAVKGSHQTGADVSALQKSPMVSKKRLGDLHHFM